MDMATDAEGEARESMSEVRRRLLDAAAVEAVAATLGDVADGRCLMDAGAEDAPVARPAADGVDDAVAHDTVLVNVTQRTVIMFGRRG